jgi:hypothetical protein
MRDTEKHVQVTLQPERYELAPLLSIVVRFKQSIDADKSKRKDL